MATTKKTSSKKPAAKEQPAAPQQPAGQVLGPGVVKRPKKDPAAAPAHAEEVNYTPSEQVFRRR